MIDAQPGIASERIPEILPEGVDPLARVQRSQCVRPALFEETLISLAHFRAEQRVVAPSFWGIDVEIGRHDIEIAYKDRWNLGL